jgi:hypothetical protein
MNAEVLKKHHYWIVAGLAPLFVLVAAFMLMSSVGKAIEKAKTDAKASLDKVKNAKAPGKGTLEVLGKDKDVQEKMRGVLWEQNWASQEPLFTWPKHPAGHFDKFNTMKFGANFVIDGYDNEQFRRVYPSVYNTEFAKAIAPTKFAGGWQKVLRHVGENMFGDAQLTSNQMWVLVEDIWIQRSMLEPIRNLNAAITAFTAWPNNYDSQTKQSTPATDRHRTFSNRNWDVELIIRNLKKDDPKSPLIVSGSLRNRTQQLQVLGVGGAMRFKLWLDPKLEPMEFPIEGAGVAGQESMPISYVPLHQIPPGINDPKLLKLEQVLDDRTVPIRRLDRLAIGYPSAKEAGVELRSPTFWPDPSAEAGGAAMPGAPMGGAEPGGNSEGMMPGAGYGPGMGGGQAAGPPRGIAGALSLKAAADGCRKRYTAINDQLRRMPIGFVIVVDQMYINDVMIAFVNSPLRFEPLQYHWRRFSDTLGESAGGSEGGLAGGGELGGSGEGMSVGGMAGAGFGSGYGAGYGSGYGPGMGAGGRGEGGMPGMGGMGMPGMGGMGGMPGSGGNSFSAEFSAISEAQANAGLVQLSVYGQITLYEKYAPPAPEGGGEATLSGEPMKPMDGDTKAATPMTDAPKTDAPKKETPKTDAPKAGAADGANEKQ